MLHILLPMAGAGSRFTKAGYQTPKPMLPIDGIPMVIKAVQMLPEAEKHTFILTEDYIQKYGIDKSITQYFPGSSFVSLNYLTEGQASTCLLAKDKINNDDELIIAACDNGMVYNSSAFEKLKIGTDAIIFTFRNNLTVLENPDAYGWVSTTNDDVIGVSVKKHLSEEPMTDHAIVGTFWFKKGEYFVKAAEKMIAENRRINNEFYVDECMQDLLDLGHNVKVFEIEEYICWGTPSDYEAYLASKKRKS